MNSPDSSRLFSHPRLAYWLGGSLVVAIVVWQGIVWHGAPDPASHGLSPAAMALSSGILVFREGLEAVLVLAAVTAGLVRNRHDHWRSVIVGVIAAIFATAVTWVIVVAVLDSIDASSLAIQAGTGLLAVVVLLVVMNWFFHKIYWTGWIAHHGRRKRKILQDGDADAGALSAGMALLGFTAVYREGFEVVLFLQDLRLKGGSGVVLSGAGIGVALTAIVAALTFAAHRRLPYKRMLVLTGVLLAVVLVVMVGESAQEMQLAGWLPTHQLRIALPDWMGVWLATFPTLEGLSAQGIATALVLGSYAFVRNRVRRAGARVTSMSLPAKARLQA